jgi:hypothetical protein
MADDLYIPRSVRRRIEERESTGPHDVAAPVKEETYVPRFRAPFDPEAATRAELVAEAALRGTIVTRADGKEGEPLVEDYRQALRQAP